MTPQRIQLSRARGWRMPPDTVKVDRTTPWGNPFIVGEDGTAAECVYWFILLNQGLLCVSMSHACIDRQKAYREAILTEKAEGFPRLGGKNHACWCRLSAICHSEVTLIIANPKPGRIARLDIAALMRRFGYRIDNGRLRRIEAA